MHDVRRTFVAPRLSFPSLLLVWVFDGTGKNGLSDVDVVVVDTEEVPLPDVVVVVMVDVPPVDEFDTDAGELEAEPESEVARGTMSSTPRRCCVKGMAACIGVEQ